MIDSGENDPPPSLLDIAAQLADDLWSLSDLTCAAPLDLRRAALDGHD